MPYLPSGTVVKLVKAGYADDTWWGWTINDLGNDRYAEGRGFSFRHACKQIRKTLKDPSRAAWYPMAKVYPPLSDADAAGPDSR